jgi:hypothetical protein
MDFIHRPKSQQLKIEITTVRKLALLPSSGQWRGRREELTSPSLVPLHSPEEGAEPASETLLF